MFSSPLSAAISSGLASVSLIVATTGDYVARDKPFGWLGAVLLAAVSSFTLWKAGSVKAWKETAEGRLQRIDDLVEELREAREEIIGIRAELKIPERIEGIIQFMGEAQVKQDAAASVRLEGALMVLKDSNDEHERRAEARCDRIIEAVTGGRAA